MGTSPYPLVLPWQLRAETSPRSRANPPATAPELSLVVPAFDEEPNVAPLMARIRAALEGCRWEVLLVDDGSADGTARAIRTAAAHDDRVRGVFLATNSGQTAAIAAGIALARAPLIATLDADLQNDPADIPAMWRELGPHDAVVGYRLHRRDGLLRRLSSRVANALRDRLTGDRVRDTGCALKLFRAEAIGALPLFEGMHRFLPTLLRIHGFSVIEHPVSHHPRAAGTGKYGIRNRALRGLRDVFAVRWMRSRVIRLPIAGPEAPPR